MRVFIGCTMYLYVKVWIIRFPNLHTCMPLIANLAPCCPFCVHVHVFFEIWPGLSPAQNDIQLQCDLRSFLERDSSSCEIYDLLYGCTYVGIRHLACGGLTTDLCSVITFQYFWQRWRQRQLLCLTWCNCRAVCHWPSCRLWSWEGKREVYMMGLKDRMLSPWYSSRPNKQLCLFFVY